MNLSRVPQNNFYDNELQKIGKEIIVKAKSLPGWNDGSTGLDVDDALALFGAYGIEQLDYYVSFAEIFLRHFGLSVNKNITGLKSCIADYMIAQIDYDNASVTSGPLDVNDMAKPNTYVSLPRADICKAKSCFYPLIDIYEAGRTCIAEKHYIEDFKRISFVEFDVIKPDGGATHRTLGICLAYGLLKGQRINTGKCVTLSTKDALAPYVKVVEAFNKLSEHFSVDIGMCEENEFRVAFSSAQKTVPFYFKDKDEAQTFVLSEKALEVIRFLIDIPYQFHIYADDISVWSSNNRLATIRIDRIETDVFGPMLRSYVAAKKQWEESGWFGRMLMRWQISRHHSSFYSIHTSTAEGVLGALGAYMAIKS